MMRLIVLGAAGRMGRRVIALSEELDDVEIVGAVLRPDDPRVGDDAGLIAGTNVLGVPLTGNLPEVEADAVIDFSSPGGTRAMVSQLADRRLAAVIATTGLDIETRNAIANASRHTPLLLAPNLSIGIALLTRLVREAAAALGIEAAVELTEVHHRMKKDAPSGTALHLAREIARARGQDAGDVIAFGRHGAPGERPPGEITLHALRMGDVVGEHTVAFGFGSERLELTHRAHSRDVFARGAIRAAAWVRTHDRGLFGLHDLVSVPSPDGRVGEG